MYENKLKSELENNPIWIAMRSKANKEELEQIDSAISSLLSLAGNAVNGFATKVTQSEFTKEELESAIKDKTGSK
jgi:hypothetical protein